jgi:hypothetical protein
VPITTKVVSSNSAHGQVYSIQHYVIKFVSEIIAQRDNKHYDHTDKHNNVSFEGLDTVSLVSQLFLVRY